MIPDTTRTPPTFTEVDAHQFRLALEILQSFAKRGIAPHVMAISDGGLSFSILTYCDKTPGCCTLRTTDDLATITPESLAEMEQEAWNQAAKNAQEAQP